VAPSGQKTKQSEVAGEYVRPIVSMYVRCMCVLYVQNDCVGCKFSRTYYFKKLAKKLLFPKKYDATGNRSLQAGHDILH